jgi:hypothetical protein
MPQTVIKYKVNDCPSDNITGILLYDENLNYYTHSGLLEGTTYCYIAWGTDNATGTWSSGNVTLTVTTLGFPLTGSNVPSSVEPNRWWVTPDETGLVEFPLGVFVNEFADSIGMSRGIFWLILSLFMAFSLGAFVYFKMHHALAAIITVMVVIVGGWGIGVVPLFLMVLFMLFGIGGLVLQQRRF